MRSQAIELIELNFIKKIKVPKLFKYDSYYLIVPGKYDNTKDLLLAKFDELFGAKISGRVFTEEQSKHAKTIIPSDKEMFIGLGYNNKIWGKHRLNIKLPKGANHATLMAVGYYIIGKIQKQNKETLA